MRRYAIVVDNTNHLRFIDLETFAVVYSLNIDFDIIDIVVTKDNKKAFITAFNPHYLLEIDLSTNLPYLVNALPLSYYSEDITLTPNDAYAIIANGGSGSSDLMNVQLNSNAIHQLPTNAQAVMVSANSRIFTAHYNENRIKLITIQENGTLEKTQQESYSVHPINLNATSDSQFLFSVSFFEQKLQVLDISNENYFGIASEVDTQDKPQSIAVNQTNDIIYVLEENYIEIFKFDPVSKALSLINTVNHGMPAIPFYGIDQIMLVEENNLLLFLTSDSVNVYTLEGSFIAQVLISPYGGIATYEGPEIHQNQYDLLVTSGSELLMIDSQNLEEKARIDFEDQSSFNIILDSIAITSDYKRAIVTTLESNKIFELDITRNMPEVIQTIDTPTRTFNLAITPDDKYAVVGGVTGEDRRLYTYNLETKELKDISVLWQSLAVNPNGDGIFIGQYVLNRIKKYFIDDEGDLNYSNQESSLDDWPLYLTFHPSGRYLFVNYGQYDEHAGIDILDTSSLKYFGLTSKIYGIDSGLTTLVNKTGDTIYVLTTDAILQYAFDTTSERLTFISSFDHTLKLAGSFGTPKMIFNENETELLILTNDSLVKYSIYGDKLGEMDIHLPRSLVSIS